MAHSKSEPTHVMFRAFKVRADRDAEPVQYTAEIDATDVTLAEALNGAIKSVIIDVQREMRKNMAAYPPSEPVRIHLKSALAGATGGLVIGPAQVRAYIGTLSPEARAKFVRSLMADADNAEKNSAA